MIHLFVITLFIAFVAPIGGFFVSGIKRALKHKQLGLTLHKGGVIDRSDCLLVVGFFMLMYVNGFIYPNKDTSFEHA